MVLIRFLSRKSCHSDDDAEQFILVFRCLASVFVALILSFWQNDHVGYIKLVLTIQSLDPFGPLSIPWCTVSFRLPFVAIFIFCQIFFRRNFLHGKPSLHGIGRADAQ